MLSVVVQTKEQFLADPSSVGKQQSETYRKGGNNYYTHFVEQQCSGH